MVDDPDAPKGTWVHWVVWNIPPLMHLKENHIPGNEGINDFHQHHYGGPCPPPGDHPHRYLFTVFAVGVDKLQVGADTSAAVIGFQLHFNTLAKAAIMGLYKRGSA